MLDALNKLRTQYAAGTKTLPAEVTAARFGLAWRAAIADPDRDRAMRALEVATLFALRRALRNGSVWIEHSLSFRGRQRLFILTLTLRRPLKRPRDQQKLKSSQALARALRAHPAPILALRAGPNRHFLHRNQVHPV